MRDRAPSCPRSPSQSATLDTAPGGRHIGADVPARSRLPLAVSSALTLRLSDVLLALDSSFMDTTRALSLGAHHTFSTTSGGEANQNFAPVHLFANPDLIARAQLRADGSPDLRVQQKLDTGVT